MNGILSCSVTCDKQYRLRVGRDSSVGIATRYGLDGPGTEYRVGARYPAFVQTGPGAHPASNTIDIKSFPRVKLPGAWCGIDHPPPCSTEVKERVELYLYSPTGSSRQVIG